jgi:hypothetical protein
MYADDPPRGKRKEGLARGKGFERDPTDNVARVWAERKPQVARDERKESVIRTGGGTQTLMLIPSPSHYGSKTKVCPRHPGRTSDAGVQ